MILENICENDIVTQIQISEQVDPNQKQEFINLISYFTPMEIEQLRLLL